MKITYQTDEKGVFTSENPESETIPMGAVLVPPPAHKEGKLRKWQTALDPVASLNYGHPGTGEWVYLDDNREKKVFDIKTGKEYSGDYDGIGSLPADTTLIEPPNEHAVWTGDKWVIPADVQAALDAKAIEQARTLKQYEINNKAQAFITKAASLDNVPDFEVYTWPLQSDEAKAYEQDKSAPTPTLDIIAASRGIERTVLIEKALQKSKLYELLAASVAGQRQKYEDALKAAVTLDDINAIVPVYNFPDVRP